MSIRVCTRGYTHVYAHGRGKCLCTGVPAEEHVYTHIYTPFHKQVWTNIYRHGSTHVYTHGYTNIYTHVYTQVYTHVYTQVYTQARLGFGGLAAARALRTERVDATSALCV